MTVNTYLHNEIMRVMKGHKGRENAIHGRDLLGVLRSVFSYELIPHLEREMREVISRKDSGICSCSRGYYLAAGPAEAKDEALAAWGEAVRLISGGQRSRDEKTNEAVRLAFGSWDRFGQTDPEMEAADRAHFIRCFRQINRRQRTPRLREGESLTKVIAEIEEC